MRAVTIKEGELLVAEHRDPQPGTGEVLVHVRAAGLNGGDQMQVRGLYPPPPGWPKDIPGMEVAGEVAALGERAERFSVGDRVMAIVGGGGQAELAAVHERTLMPVPDELAWPQAGGFPEVFTTAHDAIFGQAGLRPGETALVQGASGGVATAAIILGRLGGLTVFATSRDAARRQLALDLGAEAAFAPERATARALIEATGGRGVDAVIETVGEPTWDLSLRAVRPGGMVVVAGATGGDNPPAQLRRVFFRRLTIAGSTMGTRGELRRLVDLCATGALRPLIGATHSLADAAVAFAEMDRGELHGKIVIAV